MLLHVEEETCVVQQPPKQTVTLQRFWRKSCVRTATLYRWSNTNVWSTTAQVASVCIRHKCQLIRNVSFLWFWPYSQVMLLIMLSGVCFALLVIYWHSVRSWSSEEDISSSKPSTHRGRCDMRLEELLVSTTPSCSPDNWSKRRLHSQTVRSFIPRGPQSFCSLINCFFWCWACQFIIFCSRSLCLLRLETWRLSQETYHRDKPQQPVFFLCDWCCFLFCLFIHWKLFMWCCSSTEVRAHIRNWLNTSTPRHICTLSRPAAVWLVFSAVLESFWKDLSWLRSFTAPEREKEQFEHGNMLDHELESIRFLNFFALQEGGSRSSPEAGTW